MTSALDTLSVPPERLLTLPREIRDRIYDEILLHRINAPKTADEAEAEPRIREVITSYHKYTCFHQYQNAIRSPVMANRQIRLELEKALQRKGSTDYVLEVLFRDDARNSQLQVWPTRTYCPPSIDRIEDLQVRIRFSDENWYILTNDNLKRVKTVVLWPLWMLLERLMHGGPGALFDVNSKGEFYIDALTVVLCSHPFGTTGDFEHLLKVRRCLDIFLGNKRASAERIRIMRVCAEGNSLEMEPLFRK